jgi:hypothetical protein
MKQVASMLPFLSFKIKRKTQYLSACGPGFEPSVKGLKMTSENEKNASSAVSIRD